jgi:hypothetical protein
MNELIFVVEEAPEGGYTARALGESIFTEADDLAQLQEHVRDAVLCHFDEEEARPKLKVRDGNSYSPMILISTRLRRPPSNSP